MSKILLKTYIGLEVKSPLFVSDFNGTRIWKINFPRNTKKSIKFHENPSSGSGQTDGQRDMTKPLVAFGNFANTSKIISF